MPVLETAVTVSIADGILAHVTLGTLLGVARREHALACLTKALLAGFHALALFVLKTTVAVGIAYGLLARVALGTRLGVTGVDVLLQEAAVGTCIRMDNSCLASV